MDPSYNLVCNLLKIMKNLPDFFFALNDNILEIGLSLKSVQIITRLLMPIPLFKSIVIFIKTYIKKNLYHMMQFKIFCTILIYLEYLRICMNNVKEILHMKKLGKLSN